MAKNLVDSDDIEINVDGDDISLSVIGDFYKPGDSMYGKTGIPLPALITGSTKQVYFTVNTEKKLDNITSITCQTLKAEIRGISGYLNSTSGYNSYVNVDGYTITCIKSGSYQFGVRMTKDTAWTNVTNNTPVVVMLSNDSKFIFN